LRNIPLIQKYPEEKKRTISINFCFATLGKIAEAQSEEQSGKLVGRKLRKGPLVPLQQLQGA